MKNQFLRISIISLAILISGCASGNSSDGKKLQTSILTAGKLVEEQITSAEIPGNWKTFTDEKTLGISFRYPPEWGQASYKNNEKEPLTGNVVFEKNQGVNLHVSAPTYQWTKPELWRYPAFRTVECNEKREDTICQLTKFPDKVIGKDTRFSYLDDEKRGGIEQVAYFINPKTGYRFAIFGKTFGDYQDKTLAEQLDMLEKFRTGKLNKEWEKEVETFQVVLESFKYL